MLRKANIVFSAFYLVFFGLLTSMGVSLLRVKGITGERLLATSFCAFLTFIYVIRLVRIKQKTLLESEKSLNERLRPFDVDRDAS